MAGFACPSQVDLADLLAVPDLKSHEAVPALHGPHLEALCGCDALNSVREICHRLGGLVGEVVQVFSHAVDDAVGDEGRTAGQRERLGLGQCGDQRDEPALQIGQHATARR